MSGHPVLKRAGGLALVLIVALSCLAFGRWQLHRLETRKAWNATVSNHLAAPITDAQTLLKGQSTGSLEWRRVTFTGRFDVSQEILIRGRYYQGRYGYEVMTPLIDINGTALLVDRGWVPAGESATVAPQVPTPPAGEVQVQGRVRSGDAANRPGPSGAIIGLPVRAANRIDPLKIAESLPYPVLPGYIEMTSPRTASPVAIPAPELSEGPHLAYAIQWFFFAGLALIAPFFYRRIGSVRGD